MKVGSFSDRPTQDKIQILLLNGVSNVSKAILEYYPTVKYSTEQFLLLSKNQKITYGNEMVITEQI